MKIRDSIVTIASALILCAACSNQPSAPPATSISSAPVDPATVGTVTGRIASPRPGAIVTLSYQGTAPASQPAQSPVLNQIQMTFVPDMVIAEVGVPVSFRSDDSELHNINVRNAETRDQEFNRSIIPGTSFEHAFETSGFYDVRCDIHPAMTASIFVGTTPYTAMVGEDGTFTIANVPPGPFTMTVYNGAEKHERQIQVSAGPNEVSPSAE